MLVRATGLALFLLILEAACSSPQTCLLTDSDGEPMACIDYASAISSSEAKASCTGGGGTFRDSECEGGAIARCDAFGSTTWYYEAYLAAFSVAVGDVQQSCEESGGTFSEL